MQIKKLSQEVKYKRISTQHEIEINDKIIRIYLYDNYDSIDNSYSDDREIDVQDIETLTDIELEAIGENMDDIINLETNETYQVNEN